MSLPLEPKGNFDLPQGLDGASGATGDDRVARGASSPSSPEQSPPPSPGQSKEPFSNLKLDERHFEDEKKRDERRAQLVMGQPLGEGDGAETDTVHPGDTIADNTELLADLPDDALDLELTHMRLRTLQGLGIQRFSKVQVSGRSERSSGSA